MAAGRAADRGPGSVGEETGDGLPQRLHGSEQALHPVLTVHTEPWGLGEGGDIRES